MGRIFIRSTFAVHKLTKIIRQQKFSSLWYSARLQQRPEQICNAYSFQQNHNYRRSKKKLNFFVYVVPGKQKKMETARLAYQVLQHLLGLGIHFNDVLFQCRDLQDGKSSHHTVIASAAIIILNPSPTKQAYTQASNKCN